MGETEERRAHNGVWTDSPRISGSMGPETTAGCSKDSEITRGG